jgi:hypothetical protein
MTVVSNVFLTHGLMLLCACAATYAALPESTGRIIPEWRPAVTSLLAAMAALSLIAYPTWGELKNPGLWMFAILAAVAGAARGCWLRLYVDHSWRLIRLQKAYDCLGAAAALIGLRQPGAARRRRIVVMQRADCSRPAGRVGLSGRILCAGAYLRR